MSNQTITLDFAFVIVLICLSTQNCCPKLVPILSQIS